MASSRQRCATDTRGRTAGRRGRTAGGREWTVGSRGVTTGRRERTTSRREPAAWKSCAILSILLILAWAAGARTAAGQATERLTGVFAGRIDSEQVWNPGVETAERSGFAFGAFVDVPTPVSGLRVRADGGFARRGSLVLSDTRGNELDGEVQSEYLTFQLQAKLVLCPVNMLS